MPLPAGSYEPDIAALIDTEEEIVADRYGVGLAVARRIIADRENAAKRNEAQTLFRVISHLIAGDDLQAKAYSLAIAFGLDQLNGFHSQAEIAKKLQCTRALISHYVLGWRDLLAGGVGAFDCTKFRKHNETREIYKAKSTNRFVQARIERMRQNRKHKQ